ncbi:MAG: NAD+ synthase, partial [Candidatus Omnitrophota bacterium]|nr:NAD+ synthase [Candidatus Omnitrophota bacterium]
SVFDEKRYFAGGDHCPVVEFGKDASAGINICEDIWYPEGPQRIQALLGGAGVIINISSSPYYAQKIKAREDMLAKRAKENSAFVFYCNSVGGQDALVFDGGSSAFDYQGRLLARGRQFEEDMVAVDVDIEKLKHRKRPAAGRNACFCLPKSSMKTIHLRGVTGKENVFPGKIEKRLGYLDEIYTALIAGIRDYIRKNSFKKVVLGLSGGIDSALVAALAVDALGKENVVALTMPSMYSSSGTKQDAEKVARNLGIKLISVPINGVYKKYLDLLKPYFKGHKPGTAEENIQARIRGNILMAFSNKFGWLVFTTGNKSEIGTGYCTLYGDMTGGFAVLKDVSKTLVYALSQHRNKKGGRLVIPESVFRRAPSAELRKNQKDQDILPPYPLLDKILDLYIEKDKSLGEIVRQKIDKHIVKKVILMVDGNEYKRRQAPIGIKITPKAFGKDRRMPITNLFTK